MYYNSISRAGLAVFLSLYLFLSVVSAAPLSVRDNGSTSADAEISHHIVPTGTARGIIRHISASDQSSQLTSPLRSPSIFKRDTGDLQFVFPARRSFKSKIKSAFKASPSSKQTNRNTWDTYYNHHTQKLASGAKRVEHAVAHFVQDNKNKIAKVGLKVLSMAETYGAKALSAVPVIGKPLSKGLQIASKFTNQASNRIHANLGGNLGRAMAGIDEAEHIADYVRR